MTKRFRSCVWFAAIFGWWWGSVSASAVSLADLCGVVSQEGRSIQSFRLQGLVCAVAREKNLLALQDASACVLLEVPALDPSLEAGDWVTVTADHCAVERSRFGLQLGATPVVNNDGHHPSLSKSGQIFLPAGRSPIRVTWFNGRGASALQVEYEGPRVPRQKIPPSALWRKLPGAGAHFQPGLNFAAYTGDWYFTVPDFRRLTPVSYGVATEFDLRYRARQENTGLVFSGYLSIPTGGVYTFYVESDDGSYLYAGDPAAACRIAALSKKKAPTPKPFKDALEGGANQVWTELEGEVTFASQNEEGLALELSASEGRVQVEIAEASPLTSTHLLHRHLRVSGILETLPGPEQRTKARLIVPGASQVEVRDVTNETRTPEPATPGVLTTAEEVRQLTPAAAARGLTAKIKGVVTWASQAALVLQDATGGIYIHYTADAWIQQPRVGELWEVQGRTDPGDFSPVIYPRTATYEGTSVLPEPIHPTWDQLVNGSLDSQWVELRGVLTEVSSNEMTLLTSDGKLNIYGTDDRPLPALPAPTREHRSCLDSVMRIRGCLTVFWDQTTHKINPGPIMIGPGSIEIEEFAPPDPFALATRRIEDLMRFDASASALQRTKVKGQIVLARAGEYCLQDGPAGLRLRPKDLLPLQPGDMVEAVGFLQAGGPSPILQEAHVRAVGRLALPAPALVAGNELLNRSHDSTLVQVEAMLVGDRLNPNGRTLEMQAGQNHFLARLPSERRGLPALKAGSRLLLTGVYFSAGSDQAGGNLDAFELLLNGPSDIRVLLEPPWWTVRRAVVFLAVLSGVLAFALIWIALLRRQVERRTVQLRKQIEERQLVEQRRVMEQERTRVAQDLHDELGAGLTEMGLLGDLVKNPAVPAPEKHRYLDQLTNTARSLVTSLDEIVWAINPRYDSVASLASYYTLFAQRFLDLAGVACRPQIPASLPEYPLDAKGRHGLFLAFKEALHNVVRHSGAAEVRLKIEAGAGELKVAIFDNGRGFDPAAEAASGDGLQGMRRRLEQLGGSCAIRSRPGAGTEVELRLPVGNHAL